MEEQQIEALAVAAKNNEVYWENDGGELLKIVDVSETPVDIDNDGFPIPVAYLEQGYIDLENVNPQSIIVGQRLFPA